jgi:predicted RNA-binding Zn-ribbon protein involved in translation (DUF1610 family)
VHREDLLGMAEERKATGKMVATRPMRTPGVSSGGTLPRASRSRFACPRCTSTRMTSESS